ncbi:MAG TPA: polysaccharide deacetylase family protein [Xanthobacteraceae bacterium]|jgi:peptidoglycan/xylan/chitin deacetylase (PgdA/CDA1 family)|nr:polysaccharide deacetylase family protein [Xanthobacteraceae bacterium]
MHHGTQWPQTRLRWPDGKLVCCTFRVAYEAFRKSGRFKRSSHIDVNVTSLSHANYGAAVGIWRLMDIFDRHQIKGTIGANGLAVEKWPQTIKALHEAGHEIAAHGMTNDHDMTDLTSDEQREEARECARVITDCIGERPVGWAGPGNLHTAETLGILADEGYRWFGDAFDDDVPYVAEVNGKRIAVIPKLNYANDWRAWSGGLGNASTYFEGFRTTFDFIYQEALRGRPGAMDVIVHAELGGRPNIAVAFEQMIRYVKQYQDEVWIPTRRECADYLLCGSNLPAEPYQPLD